MEVGMIHLDLLLSYRVKMVGRSKKNMISSDGG